MDARKKSLSTLGGVASHTERELSLEETPRAAAKPDTQPLGASPDPGTSPNPGASPNLAARHAGKNLFDAKSPARLPVRSGGINRNLLLALGGTLVLLAAGGGYVWYAITPAQPQYANSAPPARPGTTTAPVQNNIAPPVVSPRFVSPQPVATTAEPSGATPSPSDTPRSAIPPNATPPGMAPQAVSPVSAPRVSVPRESGRPARAARSPAKAANSQAHVNPAIQLDQQTESIDPLLNSAYQAYRNGKFEQAQQLYRRALNLDARNADALLGLAVIAQRRGSDREAALYYARVLALDPRDAVAQAGMSALSTDNNNESRLKNLLNEQQGSASLHFALGNQYAEQSRWGEAQLAYFNAYRLEPDNAELIFNLAVSLDRLGQNASAAHYYQSALQLDASHSAGFDHAQTTQRIQALTR